MLVTENKINESMKIRSMNLNKLLVDSIYLEASQSIVVDLNTTPISENKCTENNYKLTENRNLKLNETT